MSNYFDSLTSYERDEIRSRNLEPEKKTFYEIVLDEINKKFISCDYEVYLLCNTSKTFEDIYNKIHNIFNIETTQRSFEQKKIIISHANEFLEKSIFKDYFMVDRFGFLFYEYNSDHDIKNIEYFVRLDFINYCIANNYDI